MKLEYLRTSQQILHLNFLPVALFDLSFLLSFLLYLIFWPFSSTSPESSPSEDETGSGSGTLHLPRCDMKALTSVKGPTKPFNNLDLMIHSLSIIRVG